MKLKMILYTFALTTLILNGCTRNDTGNAENSPLPDSTTPSTSMEMSQPTDDLASQVPQNNNTDGTMISEEEAKQIALSHAELAADRVTFIKSGIDRDNGKINYDIEFYTDEHTEYDYEIDPYTGAVLDYDYDAEYFTPSSDTNAQEITADTAKEIVLAKVPGATTQHIREFKSDYDNSKMQYEGKIYFEQTEYEFEIDGYSGDILEWDVEPIYGGVS